MAEYYVDPKSGETKKRNRTNRGTAVELGKIVKGIPVAEALRAVDDYLERSHGLKTREECQAHWRTLSHDEKIELTRKALTSWR